MNDREQEVDMNNEKEEQSSNNNNNPKNNNQNNNIVAGNKKVEDHVGFSTLPEQVHRKSLKRGFEFTLLVVGETGLGKSTLVNSLFLTDLYSDRALDDVSDRIKKTVAITTQSIELEEKGVRLKLTIVDTPGFGDSLKSDECWKTICTYIDSQFESFHKHESGYGIDRKKIQDTRIHCCLYFIPPYVRGLRPIDVETMKHLQTKVNIIPIIAKADSLTKKELENLKRSILSDIERFEVKIYEFPLCDSDDDENFKKTDDEIKNAIPFAVIGSNTVIESGSKRVRGRVYPWGLIDIESDNCDFNKLRTFLCSSHMQDLKDLTHDMHYENYRTEYIKSQKAFSGNGVNNSNKRSSEEADRLLQHKDMELKKMQELLSKMKVNSPANANYTSPSVNSFGHQQQQQYANGHHQTSNNYNQYSNRSNNNTEVSRHHNNYANQINSYNAPITNSTSI